MKTIHRSDAKLPNSFNEIRLLLAVTVLFAHTSVLASIGEIKWILSWFDSYFAISGFFAISGYLVTQSYLRSNSTKIYYYKRLRRIYPAYFVVIIYCLIIGYISSHYNGSEFFFNHQTIEYLLANLSFLNFLQPELPGSLSKNNIAALNGSLWTIKVELMLYVCLPLVLISFNRVGIWLTVFLFLIFGFCYQVYFTEYFPHRLGDTLARQFPGQLPFFVMGSALACTKLPKNFIYLAIIILFVFHWLVLSKIMNVHLTMIADFVLLPLAVVLIGKSRYISVGVGRIGDLSYGIYLFHFPTIQIFEYYGLYQMSPLAALIGSTGVTIIIAFFSWHLVEKKFLNR